MSEIKKGDTVTLTGKVTSVHEGLRLVALPNGNQLWFAVRDLTVQPEPEPTYRFEYKNDNLHLINMVTGTDVRSVSMSDPESVQRQIDSWASYGNIDADAARKLIAVPTVIAEDFPAEGIHCVAIRHATGWCVKIRADELCAPDSYRTAKYGTPLSEDAGHGHFPKVEGPYKQQ